MHQQPTCIWSGRPISAPSHAFTLVELLVVIGIIAVLIGTLLPVLSNARREANRAHCLSNIRSMQIAQWNYAIDNHGYLIQGGLAHDGGYSNADISWFTTLNKYYGGKLSPRCKADSSLYWDNPIPGSNPVQYRVCSYGINDFLDKDLCPWGPGFAEPKPGGQYVKIEQVKKPTETIQFVELTYIGGYAATDHVHPDLFATKRTPASAIPASVAGQIQINAHGGNIGWQARANYGFLDGHAETRRLADVYTNIYLNHFDPASPQPLP